MNKKYIINRFMKTKYTQYFSMIVLIKLYGFSENSMYKYKV